MTPHDVIAWDPDIDRISRFSVWPGCAPGTVDVRVAYMEPHEERTITLALPMSAEWYGLQLRDSLARLPELGHVNVARGEGAWMGEPRTGWNYVTHAGSRIERISWLRSIGAMPAIPQEAHR